VWLCGRWCVGVGALTAASVIADEEDGVVRAGIKGKVRALAFAHHLLVTHGLMLVLGKVKYVDLPHASRRVITYHMPYFTFCYEMTWERI
jgi:hypothetical protein